jgi:hypothetical protein
MTTTTIPSEGPKEPAIVIDDDPHIIDSRTVPFESWSRLDNNADALRIYFELTSPDVTGVHATVVEDPTTVRVTLHMGAKPGSGPFHTDLAMIAGLDVRLDKPLGDRQVLSVF